MVDDQMDIHDRRTEQKKLIDTVIAEIKILPVHLVDMRQTPETEYDYRHGVMLNEVISTLEHLRDTI